MIKSKAKKSKPNKINVTEAQQNDKIRNKTEWMGLVDSSTKKPKLISKKLIPKCKKSIIYFYMYNSE